LNEASAELIARFSIWASVRTEKVGEAQLFNVADQAHPSRMSVRWLAFAKHFGLEGVGPAADDVLKPSEYTKKHSHILEEHGIKSGQMFQAKFLVSYGYYLTFDRQLSLDKASLVGFKEELDPSEG